MTIKGLEEITKFRVEVKDHVATVTIAAPPVNSQDRRFREECIKIFDVLGAEVSVRAIVLTGDGKTFSAGADLSERPALLSEPGGYSRHNRLVRASFDCVMEPQAGDRRRQRRAAVGAGCVLALVCDIVVVAEEAFMSMTEA
jgi:enoyl-CoA hydratase/carnithine racemase